MRLMAVFLGLLWVFGVHVNSAQSPEMELKCIVGETVTFPAGVRRRGYLLKNGLDIAVISPLHMLCIMDNTFRDRLQWNSSTGLFSITGLKMEDEGEYEVQSSDRWHSPSVFQLTVYNPVSTPQVSSRNKMKPTCSVLCSVENGREVTLSWQREGETLNSTSSPDLNTPLSLLLKIEENSAPYSCVATNPVGNKTVRPEEVCFGGLSHDAVLYVVLVLRLVEFVLVTLAVLLLIHLYREGRVLTQQQNE
ncbi:hypothetical protein AGOR_G00194800 [Albula goreensis]|uniref:Ig-like domain-containing protein n=1 Tax=Albula goreensis TaxID=1534307 RepID=A0A8T3CZ30_9TELE|nr:hypothetical protein AGOR_G00194800 [Albula goreensis]